MPSLGFREGALKDWNFKLADGFRQLESDITDSPSPAFPGMCFVMRYMNHDRGRRNIHLSSSAPNSAGRGYHKVWGRVKGTPRPHYVEGWWAATEV